MGLGMTLNSKAPPPAAAAPMVKGLSLYNPLKRVMTAAEFRLAAELPVYHQPALNYPAFRLMHRLTDSSLMAVLAPRRGGMPVFIASVNPDAAQPEIAITHVPRPHVRELMSALRDDLKINNATIITTRETAEQLAQEWGRDRQRTARLHSNSWSWYQVKQAKPKIMDAPHGLAFETIDVPQNGREDPATRFALLVAGEKREAAIGLQQLPGMRRVLLGDMAESSFEGENGAIAPLFNHLLADAVQQKQNIGFIIGNGRPTLRAELLGNHVCNCEATFRKVDLGHKGSTPA